MLRRSVACLALIGLPAASALAQRAPGAPDPDSRRLLELEDSWATALIKRDGDVFQRLLAQGFVYTEGDKLMTRDDVLRDVTSGPDTVTAAHNEGMAPRLFGTTGVVTGWLIVRGRSAGKPFEHRYRFTDTWVKRNGDWQIVAAQDYVRPGIGTK